MEDKKLLEDQMVFASATTTERSVDKVIEALVSQVKAQVEEHPLDLALIFLSPHFRLVTGDIVKQIRTILKPRVLLGCTGEGVIGQDREIEQSAGITLIAAHLPNVELRPFSLQSMDWEKVLGDPATFDAKIDAPEDPKLFVMMADPFTTPIDRVLEAFNHFHAGLPMIGGLASGAHRAGGNALILNDRVLNNGAVGVGLAGAIDVDVIVSQGCRPIGRPLKVTSVDQNIIMSFEDKSPLGYLQDLITELSPEDQDLLENGLFIGRAIDTGLETLGRGDFLIRSVVGVDQETGAIVIDDHIDAGETVQFHLRDASTAEEDLEMMLAPQLLYQAPSGGLLFACNGRGTRLYSHPNGDITTMQKVIGNIDLAGFFCAGEIGPIGGKNFLHGHTASMVLFRPRGSDLMPAE
jgi:small ligand-binding sensory domain FIST